MAGLLGGLFSGAATIAAAHTAAKSQQEIANKQLQALEKQRQFVFEQLDPSVIGPQATKADVLRIQNQLALQGRIDPALLNARYGSEEQLQQSLEQFGAQSEAAKGLTEAGKEAMAGTPGLEALKDSLVAAAQKELASGATLPPDVQAELVKAGLEKSGMVTGHAGGQGAGGQILRTILGTAGIQLQQQRQAQAANLANTAQNLETQRQNILNTVFPNIAANNARNLAGTSSILGTSNAMVPQAGLSGNDIANIWLSRVGATNQLAQKGADVQAALGQALAANQQNLIGGITRAAGSAIPALSTGWTNLFAPTPTNSWGGGSSGSSGTVPFSQDWSNPSSPAFA